jgi:CRISPR-associated protein Cmr4
MFTEKRMLFLYVETPLHVGAGRGAGAVDLPIQRERVTGYPMVQAAGIKGCLRAVYREQKCNNDDNHPELLKLFGKAGDSGENFAGALAPGDARILLLPVRSLAGVFAWVTSVHALETFKRSAELAGQKIDWQMPENLAKDSAWVSTNSDLCVGNQVVLEEFSFTAKTGNDKVKTIVEWLVKNALPDSAEYKYWRDTLPKRLCILPEDAFRDFCLYGTEVQTHVNLDPEKKTVKKGALWTTESLPADSLLYAPLMASPVRNGNKTENITAAEVLQKLQEAKLTRLQLGGDETTGQGWVATRFYGKSEEK